MKRLVSFSLVLLILAYVVVALSVAKLTALRTFPMLNNGLAKGRRMAALGSLFTRELSFNAYPLCYKIYKNGQWSNWNEIGRTEFGHYLHTGNLAMLKHNRFDIHLGRRVYFGGFKKDARQFPHSPYLQELITHLQFSHNVSQIDSIAIRCFKKGVNKYTRKTQLQLLMDFKTAR